MDAGRVERRLVLRQVGLMTAIGAAIGLASAFALGRTVPHGRAGLGGVRRPRRGASLGCSVRRIDSRAACGEGGSDEVRMMGVWRLSRTSLAAFALVCFEGAHHALRPYKAEQRDYDNRPACYGRVL